MPPTVHAYLARLANTSVGPSTLRNQGAPGVTSAARRFLSELPIARLVSSTERDYKAELDAQTQSLLGFLPHGAQNWGTARKALNLFLGECCYHRFVSQEFGLDAILPFLEVPLDSHVAGFLYRLSRSREPGGVPQWPGIRSLTPTTSAKYQAFASTFASSLGPGWHRIHVDLIAWQRD